MRVQSLGREDPLEEGMASHSSILAWSIPWAEEPGIVPVHQPQASSIVHRTWTGNSFHT